MVARGKRPMRPLQKMTLFSFCLLFPYGWKATYAAESLSLIVESNVPVTPPQGSHLNWYELKADPEEGNNLIICGARRDAVDNAYYGVVYASRDGGRSWKTVFEDRSSTWVSEQSCAFGRRHRAYFISQASSVDEAIHAEIETTRIFVSSDAGMTWEETAKTGGADYTNSIVAGSPESNAQELYVFYNGSSQRNPVMGHGSTVDFFRVSEDGKSLGERQTVPGMAERNYQGVYPSSSVILGDGTPIVLFVAGKKAATASRNVLFDVGVVRFGSGGPSKPTIVGTLSARNGPGGLSCPSTLSNSLAYDRARNLLYLAYNNIDAGHCAVMLTSSRDGGQTWSPPHDLSRFGSYSSMFFPVLALGQDGVIGVLWRGRPEHLPDCWYFSILRNGRRVEDTVLLSPCRNNDSLREQSSGYLDTVIQQADARKPASIELLTRRDNLLRIGFTATPDGVFHPVWTTTGDGFGELRTARIRRAPQLHPGAGPQFNVSALSEVTDKVTVLYGGEQRLDHRSDSATLELLFRNRNTTVIQNPLYLKVEAMASDFGKVELVDPHPFPSIGAGYLNASSCLPRGSLAPGETTLPCPLVFHFTKENSARSHRYFILRFQLRVFVLPHRSLTGQD